MDLATAVVAPAALAQDKHPALIVAAQGKTLAPGAAALDAASEGALSRALAGAGFDGKPGQTRPLYALPGSIPVLQHLPIGCRLGPRCPNARKECVKTPTFERQQNHYYSCHFPLIGKST